MISVVLGAKITHDTWSKHNVAVKPFVVCGLWYSHVLKLSPIALCRLFKSSTPLLLNQNK